VTFVFISKLFSSGAKGLAGARSCPNRSSCRPSGELKCKRPSADAGEEVTLGILGEFMWFDFGYAALIHDPIGDVALLD
jgi:hypothetical protein